MTTIKSKAPKPELDTVQELKELKASLDEHSIVAITDPQGRITYVNDKFCAISKYSREELIGQNHRIINSGYHSKEFFIQMWKTISKGQVWKNDIKNRAKDGSFYWVNTTIIPFKDDEGNIYQYASIRTDITERKRLEKEILEITEREQRRIGQDLHDGLGQQLTGIELLSRVLEQQLSKKNKKAAEQASQIASHVRDAIAQTRSLARGLFPVELDSRGLMSALQELVNHTKTVAGIECSLSCPDPVTVSDYTVATHLYRIAQEALNNAIKHAKARQIWISLEQTNDKLTLAVENDGAPFSQGQGKVGMGLRIMHFRASAIGASLEIKEGNDHHTKVICSLKKTSS